jgi:site-specific recombinase XerD
MVRLFGPDEVRELMRQGSGEDLTLEGALALFETVYMPSRNLTQRTRVEYRTDIRQLNAFLAQQGIHTPGNVSLRQLQAFLAALDGRGLSGITRRRKTASLRAFFGFLAASGFLANNPTLELVPPEREYREPRFLTRQEYQALLRACSHNARDAAIVELILQTGMRLSEVARLTLDDVELPPRINREPGNVGSVSIQGKGRKHRTVPLNYKACRALKAWLTVRPKISEPALFVTKFREPMGPRAIQQLVEKYLKEAGIRGASVHTLRHTMATHHVAKGTNLETVRDLLGHADLKTTSIYVSTAKEAMKRELQDNAL